MPSRWVDMQPTEFVTIGAGETREVGIYVSSSEAVIAFRIAAQYASGGEGWGEYIEIPWAKASNQESHGLLPGWLCVTSKGHHRKDHPNGRTHVSAVVYNEPGQPPKQVKVSARVV